MASYLDSRVIAPMMRFLEANVCVESSSVFKALERRLVRSRTLNLAALIPLKMIDFGTALKWGFFLYNTIPKLLSQSDDMSDTPGTPDTPAVRDNTTPEHKVPDKSPLDALHMSPRASGDDSSASSFIGSSVNSSALVEEFSIVSFFDAVASFYDRSVNDNWDLFCESDSECSSDESESGSDLGSDVSRGRGRNE
jgi:hypothetical protein